MAGIINTATFTFAVCSRCMNNNRFEQHTSGDVSIVDPDTAQSVYLVYDFSAIDIVSHIKENGDSRNSDGGHMTKLTLKTAQKELAKHGVTLRKVEGEYQVYVRGQTSKAYFTDDLADALGTGRHIARGHNASCDCGEGDDLDLVHCKGCAITLADIDKQIADEKLTRAVEYHSTPVVKPTDTMEFKGGATVKTSGGTFTARANAYGNWYGYQGSKRVTMFFGDYVDQMFEAAAWLRTLQQASVLKGR
jgi:hypothetical protein